MGEFTEIIKAIKSDKDMFYILLDKMKPLIEKYSRILYKDEKEDVESELSLALWEAVNKIIVYDNDGQIVTYLKIALQNKFHELYRISRNHHDNCIFPDKDMPVPVYVENHFNDTITEYDLANFINQFEGTKREIFFFILIYNLSDIEISKKLNVSRQYINRMRKLLRNLLSDNFNSK